MITETLGRNPNWIPVEVEEHKPPEPKQPRPTGGNYAPPVLQRTQEAQPVSSLAAKWPRMAKL